MAYRNSLPIEGDALKAWIVDHYGLDVQKLDVRVGYMSTVVFVWADSGRFVLKCVPDKGDVSDKISAQVDLLARVRTNGLPVSKCILGRGRKQVFDELGVKMSLWTFLEGYGFVPGNCEQVRAAGRGLGQIHRMDVGLQAPHAWASLGWTEMVMQIEHTWQKLNEASGAAAELMHRLRAHVMKTSLPEETCGRILIHNDFRAQNLLFDGNRVSGVLDWDEACLAPRMFDVAYALIFFQAIVADGPLNEAQMIAFLDGYRAVYPLDANDWYSLPAWLGLALVKGLTLWGRICYVDQVNAQADMWIAHYLPLLEQVDDLGALLHAKLGR